MVFSLIICFVADHLGVVFVYLVAAVMQGVVFVLGFYSPRVVLLSDFLVPVFSSVV